MNRQNVKDIIFNVLAALIPVLIFDLLQRMVTADKVIIICISATVAFVILIAATCFLAAVANNIRYAGQWVLELTKYGSASIENIGIGIIRYDHKTGEHTFLGKLYDLNGNELFIWSVYALHLSKDNSTEHICITQSDQGPFAIGQLRFTNKKECEGTIWTLGNTQYKLNGYRTTNKMLENKHGFIELLTRFLYHSPIIAQKSYASFVKSSYGKQDDR